MRTADFVVIGGGIMGLCLAREIKHRAPKASVVLLEKEKAPGQHASGRNSGVLHAGFYYTADSLKARFTRQGNLEWMAWCRERNLPLNPCGKLVVARDETERLMLHELKRRGEANGVPVEIITEAETRKLEPRARTHGEALFSPTTSTVDPCAVVDSVAQEVAAQGVVIHTGERFVGRQGDTLHTTGGPWQAGFVVNAAGLYADTVASAFGFAEGYRILPFKGLYLYGDEPPGAFRTHLYPVPDLANPFLGVHTTLTADGHVKIGPTAIPCFWREQYGFWQNFKPAELTDILRLQASLLAGAGFDFRRLAWREIKKYSRRHMAGLASSLATGIGPEKYRRWGRPGIRAQLYDTRQKKLEMDFVVQGDGRSLHVLNAVSPAFTCALPFARYVVDKMPW